MDRVNLTSLSLALLFLCIALLVHTSSSSSIDANEGLRERMKRAEPEAESKDAAEITPKFIHDNPYDRPDNFQLDMYRLLAIALFVGFAIVMYFVVWRFCSGPPA